MSSARQEDIWRVLVIVSLRIGGPYQVKKVARSRRRRSRGLEAARHYMRSIATMWSWSEDFIFVI